RVPVVFRKKLLALRTSFLKYSKKDPCNWFVPLFVTTLMLAPALRPYCASYWPVWTLNSCSTSVDGIGTPFDPTPFCSAVFEWILFASTPSRRNVFATKRPPFEEML